VSNLFSLQTAGTTCLYTIFFIDWILQEMRRKKFAQKYLQNKELWPLKGHQVHFFLARHVFTPHIAQSTSIWTCNSLKCL